MQKSSIEKEIKIWQPVNRNGWWIKFSTYKGNILLMFTSSYTGQTLVRFFTDEDIAVKFINFVINQNPEEELPNE
jgi:hypothetical protein